MKKRALIGNGGHAREVMTQMGITLIRFVDDKYCDNSDPLVRPLSEFNPDEFDVMIAVGDSKDRKDIFDRLPIGTKFFSFIHPSAQLMSDSIDIGEGSFIGANSILTCDIKMGKHVVLNRGVQIGHDCKIGDFFSAMPGAIVSGVCRLGDIVYLGTNSVVIEYVDVCDNVKIGALGCVINNVTYPGTYVGIPVKKIKW